MIGANAEVSSAVEGAKVPGASARLFSLLT